MAFYDDVIFPESISLFAFSGKRIRKTDIIENNNGFEQRNIVWTRSRRSYDAGMVPRPASQWNLIDDLFEVVAGSANGFLLKDQTDYQVSSTQGKFQPLDSTGAEVGTIGFANSMPTYQMYKQSAVASRISNRIIQKPKAGTYIINKNGTPLTAGSAAGNYALDTTTGIITLVADVTKTITGITKANPGSVTCVGHGFTTGNKIYISGVAGMVEVNNTVFTITSTGADTFTLGVNTTAYTTYTSGGTAKKFPSSTDTLTFSTEFYVPVRFATDDLDWNTANKSGSELLLDSHSVPLIEIRL